RQALRQARPLGRTAGQLVEEDQLGRDPSYLQFVNLRAEVPTPGENSGVADTGGSPKGMSCCVSFSGTNRAWHGRERTARGLLPFAGPVYGRFQTARGFTRCRPAVRIPDWRATPWFTRKFTNRSGSEGLQASN